MNETPRTRKRTLQSGRNKRALCPAATKGTEQATRKARQDVIGRLAPLSCANLLASDNLTCAIHDKRAVSVSGFARHKTHKRQKPWSIQHSAFTARRTTKRTSRVVFWSLLFLRARSKSDSNSKPRTRTRSDEPEHKHRKKKQNKQTRNPRSVLSPTDTQSKIWRQGNAGE